MSAAAKPMHAFGLIERLHRLSWKLDVVANSYIRAKKANELPGGALGEVYITVDVAEELDEVVCALDAWARENGGPQDGPLTGTDAQEARQ